MKTEREFKVNFLGWQILRLCYVVEDAITSRVTQGDDKNYDVITYSPLEKNRIITLFNREESA